MLVLRRFFPDPQFSALHKRAEKSLPLSQAQGGRKTFEINSITKFPSTPFDISNITMTVTVMQGLMKK